MLKRSSGLIFIEGSKLKTVENQGRSKSNQSFAEDVNKIGKFHNVGLDSKPV